MQAVYISTNLIGKALDSLALSSGEKDHFENKYISNSFKLRGLPGSAIPVLRGLAELNKVQVIFAKTGPRPGGETEALVSGSETDLNSLCSALIKQGGTIGTLGETLQQAAGRAKQKPAAKLKLGGAEFELGKRTLIMGILNVTPDSFSDGGRFNNLENALACAFKMAEEGADIIDVGGESTRPGSKQITAEEELKRVMPLISALKKDSTFKLPLSIDTYKAEVAEKALGNGVEMLNDVWGFKEDSNIGGVASRYNVPVCLMHNRRSTEYRDLVPDIIAELQDSIELAHRAGITDQQIVIDPGIGFGKNYEQNLETMLHLPDLCRLGYPLLLGTSRKSLIGKTLELPADERIEGTAATVAYGITAGAAIVRVHDVRQMKRVALMTDAITRR